MHHLAIRPRLDPNHRPASRSRIHRRLNRRVVRSRRPHRNRLLLLRLHDFRKQNKHQSSPLKTHRISPLARNESLAANLPNCKYWPDHFTNLTHKFDCLTHIARQRLSSSTTPLRHAHRSQRPSPPVLVRPANALGASTACPLTPLHSLTLAPPLRLLKSPTSDGLFAPFSSPPPPSTTWTGTSSRSSSRASTRCRSWAGIRPIPITRSSTTTSATSSSSSRWPTASASSPPAASSTNLAPSSDMPWPSSSGRSRP